jgi:hypothetical protein
VNSHNLEVWIFANKDHFGERGVHNYGAKGTILASALHLWEII